MALRASDNSPRNTIRKRARRPAVTIDNNGKEIVNTSGDNALSLERGYDPRGPPPITVSVAKFRELSGLSRPTIYRMLRAGSIRSIRIGTKRLILLASYLRLVEAQLAEQTKR